MTSVNSICTTICTKITDSLNWLSYWFKTIFHWLKGLRITINSVPIEDKEPIFQIPNEAKTRGAIEAYVDQYVKDSIAWQEREFQRWKKLNIEQPINSEHRLKENRRWVIIWSFVSALLFGVLVYTSMLPITLGFQELLIFDFLPASWPSTPPVQDPPNTPLFFSIVALLITAPIAYAIWTIRDENAAQTLENARKDTNLKDFQRLSEWASGFHLPEDKSVSLKKTTTKGDEKTKEKSKTTETYSTPKDAQQISRRMGAESLQVAAIYQLQAFMHGAYGEQFMKPAFHLLQCIWAGLLQPLLPSEPSEENLQTPNYSDQYDLHESHDEKFEKLSKLRSLPLFQALNKVLFDDGGRALRLFSSQLDGLCLAGFDATNLNLSDLTFKSCDLRFSKISHLNAVGAIFEKCDFTGSHIEHANLQGSDMTFSHFDFTKTSQINAQFTDFSNCFFIGAELVASCYDYANFQSCEFRKAEISTVDFFGSNLRFTKTPYIRIGQQVRISLETDFGNSPSDGTGRGNAEACRKQCLDAGAILVNHQTDGSIQSKKRKIHAVLFYIWLLILHLAA
ncbi:MAG: pentapeptide repeat-containing protein [Pseudomonadota bacterium]|nr:pentapeptide repeat-containing protein [Pseudomonadota bacterium]